MNSWLRSILVRWSNDDRSALRQMTNGKTVGERTAAFNRTTINQSKFLLLAAAPFCLVLVARELSGSSGWFWWVLFTAAAIWFVIIAGVMFVGMFRVVANSDSRD